MQVGAGRLRRAKRVESPPWAPVTPGADAVAPATRAYKAPSSDLWWLNAHPATENGPLGGSTIQPLSNDPGHFRSAWPANGTRPTAETALGSEVPLSACTCLDSNSAVAQQSLWPPASGSAGISNEGGRTSATQNGCVRRRGSAVWRWASPTQSVHEASHRERTRARSVRRRARDEGSAAPSIGTRNATHTQRMHSSTWAVGRPRSENKVGAWPGAGRLISQDSPEVT